MPYAWVEPEVFMQHDGVTIYHIYKDDDFDGVARAYWYGTRPSCSDSGSGEGGEFDVRDLPDVKGASADDEEGRRTIIRAAIDRRLLTEDGIAEGADRAEA